MCVCAMTQQGKTLYGSLPPLVTGKKFGEVILKITKFSPSALPSRPHAAPTTLIGYTVRFHWWGQQSDSITLPLPWKIGNPIEEAIFPIRVTRYYFEEYLSDMNEIVFEILDPQQLPYGSAILPMESVMHRNLIYREGIPVFRHGAATPKTEIAKLFIEFVCHFDQPTALRKPEQRPQLSVFQRVEALVTADSSSRYTEWPEQIKNSQTEVKAPSNKNRVSASAKEVNPPLPPLLARKEAARKHLAGLRTRDRRTPRTARAGATVFSNQEFEIEMESASIHESDPLPLSSKDQDECDQLGPQVRKTTVEVEPPRIVDSNFYLMEKAQELLSRVQQATKRSSVAPPLLTTPEIFTISTTETQSQDNHWKRRQYDTLDIDWLLKGVPEIYEEPGIVSDDLVEQLVSAGGLPPSQLEYPILYSTTQAILSRLRDVQQIHLQFLDLFIFGARCGLRKDRSFIVVRPPPGCFDRNHERNPVTIDLPTPQDLFSAKHKNILKHYHVGTVPMNQQKIVWTVNLTDSLIQDWLNYSAGTGLNCIQMELYSYLTPPSKIEAHDEKGKGRHTAAKAIKKDSALLIGSVNIPLSGLFSSPHLLINISSSIILDAASHSLIEDRFQRMPIGVKLKQLPNGNSSAGFIKCQLSLRNEFGKLMNSSSSIEDPLNPGTCLNLNSIATFHTDTNETDLKQIHSHLDDALQYLPTELPLSSPQPPSRYYLCVAIHHLTLYNFESIISKFGTPRNCSKTEIICIYKISLASSSLLGEVNFATTSERLLFGEKMVICDGRIHPLDSAQGYPGNQYFEVWIRRSDSSRLVGLFPYSLDSPLTVYSILNPITNSAMGSAKVEVSILETEERAKIWLAKSLTNERVRGLLTQRVTMDQAVVPDKPQEPRSSLESEALGTPLQPEDLQPPDDPARVSPIAPPKSSMEPDLSPPHDPLNQQGVTFPMKPEPVVRFSAACSVDSLDLQSDEKIMPHLLPGTDIGGSNMSDQEDEGPSSPFSCDQSMDSLVPSSIPPAFPPTVTVTPPPELISLPTSHNDTTVHVLELSIEGSVDPFISSEDSLGYFVCYDFPGLEDHEVPLPSLPTLTHGYPQKPMRTVRGGLMSGHSTALWWDNECPILNSRNVHTFDCCPGNAPLLALGLDPTHPRFVLVLVKSDLDGNLPIATHKVSAEVHLPMPVLIEALSRPNFRQRVTLDIELSEKGYSGKLTLLLSHRVVPSGALGRTSSSLEKLMLPVNVTEGEHAVSKDEMKVMQGIQVFIHLDKILHLADDLPTLRSSHEMFLFCSVTTPQTLPTDSFSHFITPTRPCHHSIDWDIHFTLSMLSAGHSKLDLQEWSLNLLLYSRPLWLSAKKTERSQGVHLGDLLIGSSVIELSPLCSGFSLLDGWYHIMDSAHRSIGQIKLTVSQQSNLTDALLCPTPASPPSTLSHSEQEGEFTAFDTESDLSHVLSSIIQNLENATNSLLRISVHSPPVPQLPSDDISQVNGEDRSFGDQEAKSSKEDLDWDLNSLTSSSAGYDAQYQDELVEGITEDVQFNSYSGLSEPSISSVLESAEVDHLDTPQENPQIPESLDLSQESTSPPCEDHHPEEEEDCRSRSSLSGIHSEDEGSDFHFEGGESDPHSEGEESDPHSEGEGSDLHSADLRSEELHVTPEPLQDDDEEERNGDPSLPDVLDSPVLEEPSEFLPLAQPSAESPVQSEEREESSHGSNADSPQPSESATEEDDSAEDLLSLLNIVAEHSDDQSAEPADESEPVPEESKSLVIPPPKLPITPFSPIVPPPPVTLSSILSNHATLDSPSKSKEMTTVHSAPSHRCNLSKEVRDLSDVIRTVMKSTQVSSKWERSPGRRRQFMDAETERITRAMKVSLSEYSRAANPRSSNSP